MMVRISRIAFVRFVVAVIGLAFAAFAEQGSVTAKPTAPVGGATEWYLSPAFPAEGGKGFVQDLLGEFGGEGKVTLAKVSERWKKAVPDEKGHVNFLKHFTATNNKVAYALATFGTESPGVAIWRFGSDDGIRVWVNGKLAYSFAAGRAAQKDSDKCLSAVGAGENTVLLKIANGTGEWGFYFRLAEVISQEEGSHATIVSLSVPPYLLYGSQYPIDQWAAACVVNNGTSLLDSVVLDLRIRETRIGGAVIPNLPVLASKESRVGLRVPRELQTGDKDAPEGPIGGEERFLEGRAMTSVGDERVVSSWGFSVRFREVHPLLTGRVHDEDGVLRFVHASDTHIVAEETVLSKVKTAENLKGAVRAITRAEPAPDFVMVTGDLTLDSVEGLGYFGELMKPLRVPWLAIPGNHDKPGGEEAALRLFGQNGLPLYYSFDYAGYHIVALDGQPPSRSPTEGGFIPEEIDWLKRDLQAAKDKETLVFVHQHPLYTRIEERDSLVDWPELVGVLESYPQVKSVFCGHAHADSFVKHHGIRYIMTTATAYQFSPKEIPWFANEAGVRLMEYKEAEATSRFLRIDGSWREDPSVENCPEFVPPKQN